MSISQLIQKMSFRLRPTRRVAAFCRRVSLVARGAQLGKRVALNAVEVNWPHQIKIDDDCIIESGTVLKFADQWKPGPNILIGARTYIGHGVEFNVGERVTIGTDCLIASGARFVDHDHGTSLDSPMRTQPAILAPIVVENDVWIGANVVVLKGVTIGSGAIVGAGAVVTKSIPPREIWVGVPAKKVGDRSAL